MSKKNTEVKVMDGKQIQSLKKVDKYRMVQNQDV